MADAFQPRFVDLVRSYSTTAGTSDFVLGPAVNGYSGFASALSVGDRFYYSAVGVDKPAEREVGRGTLLANGIVKREPVSGPKTNFTSGTKSIALIAAAEWFDATNAAVAVAAGAPQSFPDRAALATSGARSSAYLREPGRHGTFAWDGSNLSAKVVADSAQGLYVAPASDPTGASGAWVRKFEGEVWFNWFGAIAGDAGGANAAANDAAWSAMQSVLGVLAVNALSNFRGVHPIRIGLGTYEGSKVWECTVGSGAILGSGMGHVSTSAVSGGTRLKFYGSGGLRIQSTNTSDVSTGDSATHQGGDQSIVRDLGIEGDFSAAEAERHGLHIRGQSHVQNVAVANFAGDGIRLEGNTAGVKGNVNSSTLLNVHAWGCRSGLVLTGNNTGSSVLLGGSFNNNRAWGIDSSGSIGSMFYGCELSNNGTVDQNDGVNIGASCVSHAGNRYFAISGQEAGASTNAPSGTSADNAYWAYYMAAGAVAGIPAWTSGMMVRAGGCARGAGSNNFNGCYAEINNQGKFQGQQTDLVTGGKLSLWCWTLGSGATQGFGTLRAANNNILQSDGAFQTITGTVTARLGDQNQNISNRILFGSEPTIAPTGHSLFYGATSANLFFSYAGSLTTQAAFVVTGPSTADQFGTGAAVPHAFWARDLRLGDGTTSRTNARAIIVDNAAPTTGAHGQGEFCHYRGSAPGLIGWKCTTAGTPGTWEALYSGYGTGPVGYATGAGGAVAQATSKSTGVTLNKLCGQVTMNGAALAAGASVSFTITNSQVAASDSVSLSLASGNATAGTYNYQVDKVGAGSFVIAVKNISAGSLSEALVFNFAVLKAVAA